MHALTCWMHQMCILYLWWRHPFHASYLHNFVLNFSPRSIYLTRRVPYTAFWNTIYFLCLNWMNCSYPYTEIDQTIWAVDLLTFDLWFKYPWQPSEGFWYAENLSGTCAASSNCLPWCQWLWINRPVHGSPM